LEPMSGFIGGLEFEIVAIPSGSIVEGWIGW